MSIQPKSCKDLIFTWESRCACPCCTIEPETQAVYVNGRGEIERYDHSKAFSHEYSSLDRSVNHLLSAIWHKVFSAGKDPERFTSISKSVITEIKDKNYMSIEHIAKINQLLLQYTFKDI